MTQQPTLRRALPDRGSRLPGVAAALAALALAAAFFVPAAAVPTAVADASSARASRVCPTIDTGAQVGVGSASSGLAQAPLATPGARVPVAAGDVVAVTEPIRLSAPEGTAFWGVASASAEGGTDQGLSLAGCQQPRARLWFTGVRSNSNARADVVLVNLDSADAAVNLSVWGGDGALAVPGGRGVVVGGQSQKVLALGPLVDSPNPVTLELTTSSGRVAAFVRQRLFNGAVPSGADWITPSAEPATTVVIPSVPTGAGARTLILANPGDRTAQVKVEVLGADGAFSLVGVDQVDVPAGTTRTFGLEASLAGKAAALRLTSTREILGAVEADGAGDWATLDGAPAVGGGVVATIPLPQGFAPAVTVANPAATPAHVSLAVTDASGKELATSNVDVPASASIVVEPGVTSVAKLTLTSSEPTIRVGVAASGTLGTVSGLALLALSDASANLPSLTLTPQPRLGT